MPRYDATELYVRRMHPHAIVPTRTHSDDAGLDLYTLEKPFTIEAGQAAAMLIRTGFAFQIPIGFFGMVLPRSSAFREGLLVNGVIDSGYRGEVMVSAWNVSGEDIRVKPGTRIGQMIILPHSFMKPIVVEELEMTERESKGFGSSGTGFSRVPKPGQEGPKGKIGRKKTV